MDVLVVENECVDFLVVGSGGVDFLVVGSGGLDFLGLVIESLGQKVQYQKELLQVLVDFVLDLD